MQLYTRRYANTDKPLRPPAYSSVIAAGYRRTRVRDVGPAKAAQSFAAEQLKEAFKE
jgi:hypothetical protein